MSPLFNVTNACKQISYEQLVTSTLFGLIYYYLQLNEDNNYKKYQYISIINEILGRCIDKINFYKKFISNVCIVCSTTIQNVREKMSTVYLW